MRTALALLALLGAIHAMPQMPLGKCQCEQGSYWCASDDRLSYTFNCSGTDEAKSVWKQIKDEDPTPDACRKMANSCDGRNGAVGMPLANATCEHDCYDFCW